MRNWVSFGGSTDSGFVVGLVFGFLGFGGQSNAADVFWGSKVEV